MKVLNLIIVISSVFLFGCSTSYVAKEFDSKKDYYNYLNDHVENKRLNIILNDDSILTAAYGAKIQDDFLIFNGDKVQRRNVEIPLSEINSIDYKSVDYKSAYLSLKNGRELYAENIIVQPNSLKM